VADPTWANVGLLLHLNGTDGSTTFTDSSQNAHTVSVEGTAEIDTAQSVFGGASALFASGSTGRLTVPLDSSITIATGDFTIGFRVRFASTGDRVFLSQYDSSGIGPWNFQLTSGYITFNLGDTGNAVTPLYAISFGTVSTGVWYAVEASRSGNVFRLFVDGTEHATETLAITLHSSDKALCVGDYQTGGGFGLDGWLDEVIIVKGEALNITNFTPNAAEYENATNGGYIAEDSGPLSTDVQILAVEVPLGDISEDSGPLSTVILAQSTLAFGWISEEGVGGVLGDPQFAAFTDYTAQVDETSPIRYRAEIITPSGRVTVPISSWQATLNAGQQSYAACVVPGADAILDELYDATEFIIYRTGNLYSGVDFEQQMVRAPVDTIQYDEGKTNRTVSMSGYMDGLSVNNDPNARYDRTLTGLRSISQYAAGVRIRCKIDWLLQPGTRAYYGETSSLIVAYINFYAIRGDSYMDVGSRI